MTTKLQLSQKDAIFHLEFQIDFGGSFLILLNATFNKKRPVLIAYSVPIIDICKYKTVRTRQPRTRLKTDRTRAVPSQKPYTLLLHAITIVTPKKRGACRVFSFPQEREREKERRGLSRPSIADRPKKKDIKRGRGDKRSFFARCGL